VSPASGTAARSQFASDADSDPDQDQEQEANEEESPEEEEGNGEAEEGRRRPLPSPSHCLPLFHSLRAARRSQLGVRWRRSRTTTPGAIISMTLTKMAATYMGEFAGLMP